MKRQLLDVNVLLALIWPRHASHSVAHAWFVQSGQRAWASNPLVQLGVLRLLTNPAVTQGAVNAASALGAVREATRHPGHEFWPLDKDLLTALQPFATRITGPQQWSDALLLWHAAARDGMLVTFDSGLEELANDGFQGRVLLLKNR